MDFNLRLTRVACAAEELKSSRAQDLGVGQAALALSANQAQKPFSTSSLPVLRPRPRESATQAYLHFGARSLTPHFLPPFSPAGSLPGISGEREREPLTL
ncbi:unnamed protein product [Prorocentrum cordatum]|uniref:Uncharacterized protein n=1 Tax=Prorocentrum cordatum TaxID=2364126 RepID=A0ABN9TVH1_9DINO|nr:unnamed protein product [Polarella glacialis]